MKTMMILVAAILLPAISHAFGMQSATTQVSSTQAASVSRSQIEAVLAVALAEKLAADGVGVVLDRAAPPLTGEGEPVVVALDVDPARSLFAATLHRGAAEQTLTGRYSRQVQALAPLRNLAPGEVIAEEDLDWLLVDEKALNPRVASEPEQLVDMEVRRPLKAGKLVLARDVRAPRLIHKGSLVTVRLATGAMDLSMQGRAMADAGMGEVVRVMNLVSKKTIEGIVIGPQAVEVALPIAPTAPTTAMVAQDLPGMVR